MIQKEVNEIKGTMKYKDCSIQRITGCYVDTEKNTHFVTHEQFLCLPEEDQHKYFAIIKRGLSGKVGKNLINIGFELDSLEKRDNLMTLVKSELKENAINEALFTLIKDNYDYPDNYYIMACYGAYDVPGITDDGIMMEDASDDVYKFVLTLMCPMKPSKPGLTYNPIDNTLENAVRNLLVEAPINGFLFPSFNGRATDIHSVLFYTKKQDEIDATLLDAVLGCKAPTPAKKQSEIFVEAVSAIEELTFDNAIKICETVCEKEEDAKNDEEKMVISERETLNMLEQSGIQKQAVETFTKVINEVKESKEPILTNNLLPNSSKLKIKTGITEISLPTEFSDSIEIQKVDGRNCLVIEINDELTVNGIRVNNFKDISQVISESK